ncbi:molybdopterin-synthase adenylyltransferase MoeB [Mucilaginibacter arboris]|uniref:Molybdopterin-synthase adenylyltransferase n=1 Tax=Mucilaginibacter arboris TaxID=2682090 RepID=A0A7K1T0N7_9SPHI|nr:molybdopterin-synthase adenylyltransferase MoeB [Mucilaginibacter arboris]MVN23136.1 molybdopterin-synthase adenylyltransferase MoeB [Mucilaginibacter arboris]
MLTREELKRYHRQMILPEIGLSGQQKLKAAKVLMIGAGGLGCPVLQYLAAAGVSEIGVVDDDVVDESNLHRQVLYSPADVGKAKAMVAAEKLRIMNPFVELKAYHERLKPENAEMLIGAYHLIIDGSDNFPTRYLVNDTCVQLNKPLVFGSIFKFEGNVSVFNYQNGPQYRDIFPEAPADNDVPNCAEIGVLGVLPGIVGLYMANEAIKIICETGEILSGKLMTVNALDNSVSVFKFGKQAHAKPVTEKQKVQVKEDNNQEISLKELENWLEKTPEEVYLVDVREEYEFEDYNIGGINIPFDELADKLDALPQNKKIVFCCRSGQRSKMAVALLQPAFKGAMYNLKNGIY